MSIKSTAGNSLIYYTEKNYAGTSISVLHGATGNIATGSNAWIYQSVAMTGMQSFIFSDVNTSDASMSYLGHVENIISISNADLTELYVSSDQFPLNYLGLDPSKAALVWLDIDATQSLPDAVAASSLVGGSTTNITTLGLPNRPGALGFVALTAGSSVVASCRYGNYNTTDGTVTWSGNGTITLEYTGGTISLVSSSGFPEDWEFSDPQPQGDGTWVVSLSSVAPASWQITSLTASPDHIVNDGVSTSILSATIVDSNNQPASGVTVSWSTTMGELDKQSSVTEPSGLTTVNLTDSGDSGNATITASVTGDSQQVSVSIQSAGTKELMVMGARSSNRAYGEYITSRLVALDKQTSTPVVANWSYEGLQEISSTDSFFDTHPGNVLNVSVSGYSSVSLNVSNVIGSGGWYDENDDPGSHGAFAARRNSGDIVVWGEDSRGAIAPLPEDNYGASFLCATSGAFAAVRGNNTVFSWGNVDDGGDAPDGIKTQPGIVDVRGSRGTFLVRSTVSPYIQTWGRGVTTDTGDVDLNVPSNISSMSDISLLQMTEDAACVVNQNGEIFAWGDASCGGAVTSVIQSLTGVSACYSSRRAFAALLNGGQVVAWGDSAYGGDASAVSAYSDIVRICATESAFVALRSNGQIIAWGDNSKGGDIPDDYLNYTDIVDIKSSYGAFAALRNNGQVICWGESTHGGNSPDTASLTDVLAITGTSWSFSALHKNGTVSAWGNSDYGGDTTAVAASLNNVCAIYPNSRAFFALKNDGSFVVWGDSTSGGEQTMIPSSLNGNITYLA